MTVLLETARERLRPALEAGHLLCLTGAGVSAESGIPTFRGQNGFWTVGSENYAPEEIATHSFFLHNPLVAWDWYRHRFQRCRDAAPNAGHQAFVDAEQRLRERFHLVTQNIDHLHRRAGNTAEQTIEIHGSIRWMRCVQATPDFDDTGDGCPDELVEVPWDFLMQSPGLEGFQDPLMTCTHCGNLMRPHVLWFDEYYQSSNHYRLEEALDWLGDADALLIAGCSGTLFLANHFVDLVAQRTPLIIIDPEAHEFVEKVVKAGGLFLQGTSAEWLPPLLS